MGCDMVVLLDELRWKLKMTSTKLPPAVTSFFRNDPLKEGTNKM